MKVSPWLLLACIVILFTSCTDDAAIETTGNVTFSMNKTRNAGGRTASSIDEVAGVLVSIETRQGNPVYDLKELPFVKFGDRLLTGQITLPSGNYKLTKFLLVDDDKNVLFATPLAGSEHAPLVEHPLPIEFSVSKDESNMEIIEIVDVSEEAPELYGYASFAMKQTSKFLIRLEASIGNVNAHRVRTWVRNLDTNERKWVTLTPGVGGEYKGTLVVEKGEYEFETFLEWKVVETHPMHYARSQRRAASIAHNTLLQFDRIQEGAQKRIHTWRDLVVTTPIDICDPIVTAYIGNDICFGYFYYDKYILASPTEEYLNYFEITFGGSSCGAEEFQPRMELVLDPLDPNCSAHVPNASIAASYAYLELYTAGSYEVNELYDTYRPENEMSDWSESDPQATERFVERKKKAVASKLK